MEKIDIRAENFLKSNLDYSHGQVMELVFF